VNTARVYIPVQRRIPRTPFGGFMLYRSLGGFAVALALTGSPLRAQTSSATAAEPSAQLTALIADLKAPAPSSRNAAAYEIASLGPAAAAAVPALIEALDDEVAAVRFPVTVALGEIGPAAAAAVPRLKQMMEEDLNDEVATGAKRAIRHIRPEALSRE
jgi:HEAT repeat protein